MRKKIPQPVVVGDLKPIDVDSLSIEDQALAELLVEASERAEAEGRDGFTLYKADLDAKIKMKKEARLYK